MSTIINNGNLEPLQENMVSASKCQNSCLSFAFSHLSKKFILHNNLDSFILFYYQGVALLVRFRLVSFCYKMLNLKKKCLNF